MAKHCAREIYSPKDLAWILDMDSEAVGKLLSSGDIASFEVPGGHKRVAHDELVRFSMDRAIDLPEELSGPKDKQRVLVVEDDADLLEIVSMLLKDEPRIDVRSESNGFTAGLQVAGWHPDLILLDFLMPGVSGFDVCSNLRLHEETADIAVLALTSLSSKEDQSAIYASGVSDYMAKPFHSEQLLSKVRQLLGLDRLES